jgi:hypothetical protein
MSDNDFAATDSSYSWGYDEVVKPPKWLLTTGIVSVTIGAIWSVICLLDVEGILEFSWLDPKFIEGLIGYLLTLTVPSFLIWKLRGFQISAKDAPGGYDSYAGLQMANKLKYLAITGLLFSLIAIYVAILPWAEKWA